TAWSMAWTSPPSAPTSGSSCHKTRWTKNRNRGWKKIRHAHRVCNRIHQYVERLIRLESLDIYPLRQPHRALIFLLKRLSGTPRLNGAIPWSDGSPEGSRDVSSPVVGGSHRAQSIRRRFSDV